MATPSETLHRTPFYDLHVKLGARIVPFAGYEMPVQYPTGILAEHNWTRSSRRPVRCLAYGPGLCCRARITTTAAARLEKLVPGDIAGLGAAAASATRNSPIPKAASSMI